MSATSDLIKRLRRLGLSQSEISRRTGIPQPRLSRWEAGAPAGAADDALTLLQLEQTLGGQAGAPLTPTSSAATGTPEVAEQAAA